MSHSTPENNSDNASRISQWIRKRFKKNKVWMAVDPAGQPVMDKGKMLIKYQLDQPHKYWVRADNIADVDEDKQKKQPAKRPENSTQIQPTAPPLVQADSDADKPNKDAIHVYTDGAASGNPGPAGIGVFLQYGPHEREISRFIGSATNNIAELMAVKAALEAIKRKDIPVRLYTDSSYVLGLLTSGWKAHKNKELVTDIRKLCEEFKDLKLIKVKGHGGICGNEKADHLATSAIKKHAP